MKYNVTDETLAVIPNGKHKSNIIENSTYHESNKTTKKVIEDSCEYFGVSYNSRVEGSEKIINTKYKTPIIIEETNRIIFFPISSPSRSNTVWISFNNIKEYYPRKNRKRTVVVFVNEYKMEIDVSYYSFNQQYLRAAKLNSILSNRILGK